MKTSISNLLQWGTQELNSHSIPNPTREANLLLQHVLKIDKYPLLLNPEITINSNDKIKFQKSIKRRAKNEPFAYITGEVIFYNQKILVNKHCLIPRPETEILVNLIIDYLKNKNYSTLSIADIGTGSGAIAISLLNTLPILQIQASDKYALALRQAKINLKQHKLTNKITLHKGDLLQPFKTNSLDIIIANLPYVPKNIIHEIDSTIKDFEPYNAVFSGSDGLDCIKKLLKQARTKTKPNAAIFLEIWPTQTYTIEELVKKYFPSSKLLFHTDLEGIIRFCQINL